MKELFMIIWLFPILFMVHDFEEIIIINAWKEKMNITLKTEKLNSFLTILQLLLLLYHSK